jgi:outer membrane protein OmpA-like peptidoglycan-associated protein
VLTTVCAVPAIGGCSRHRVKAPEMPPGQALVVLLPDPETGAVGRALVSNPSGTVELDAGRESTVAAASRAPEAVHTMSESEVRHLFGDALSALPPGLRRFTLYFRFESEELTDESREMARDVVRTVKSRKVPDVLIVGHTDTTGSTSSNFDLGLRRANTVRDLLREAGLELSSMDVISHGETDLMVPTADGVLEPKNRRVDITVR